MITHEQHEANSAAWEGVNTTDDVSTYLKIFFPSITQNVIDTALELYPEDDYSSPGLRFSDMKQSFDLTAHNLALTQALNNKTWNAMVALDSATHGTDQSYYWYSTYSLSSSSSTGNDSTSGGPPTKARLRRHMRDLGHDIWKRQMPGGSTSVNSTIAISMQKYLMSFVLTGNPNTMWSSDKLYWPQYLNGSYSATELVFNTTFYTQTDALANDKSLFWNKALWY